MDYNEVLKRVSDHYETLFNDLKSKFTGETLLNHETALDWEERGCTLIMSILRHIKIDFEIEPKDIRPTVTTLDGKKAKIDFRMKVGGQLTYFGVTHFKNRPFERDSVKTNEPVHQLRRRQTYLKGKLLETRELGEGKIMGRRSQKDYLNKRVVARLAKEGKNRFPHDYIYIIYPHLAHALLEMDGIPAGFEFGLGYDYRENGIKGVMLVGNWVEVDDDGNMRLRCDKLTIKTLSFPGCSLALQKVLKEIDCRPIDLTDHLNQWRAHLESMGIDPKSFREFSNE